MSFETIDSVKTIWSFEIYESIEITGSFKTTESDSTDVIFVTIGSVRYLGVLT